MKKLCFSCFKKIPLFAGKCPYCLDNYQGVHGRLIIGIVVVLALLLTAHMYGKKEETHSVNNDNSVSHVIEELSK